MIAAALRLLIVAATAHGGAAYVYDGGLSAPRLQPNGGLTTRWSPDGSQLAWADARSVWVENADGTRLRRVLTLKSPCATTCLSAATLLWSPDGSRLVASGVDPATTGLVSIDVGTGRVTQLVHARRFAFWTPIAFSTDGRRISFAYTSGDWGTASCCKSQLRVMDADGSHVRVLFDFKEPIHDGPGRATWSPDGTRIAFTCDGRDAHDPRFAFVDVATGKVHRLPGRYVYDVPPAWSPDGRRLAIGQYRGPAFTIGVDGRGYHALGRKADFVVLLPDGELLLARERTVYLGGRLLFTLPRGDELLALDEAA